MGWHRVIITFLDAIWEQQLKRTQSGAVEMDAIGEQQLKRTQSGAAAEADAIGSSS